MPTRGRFNVGRNFALVADRWETRPALVADNTEFTYGALNERVNAAARGLQQLGVGHGDRVALLLPNSPEFVIAHFAVQKLGAVSVLVNYRLTADEIAFTLEDAAVGTFLYDEAFADVGERSVQTNDTATVVVGDGSFEALLHNDSTNVPTPASRNEHSFIAYTSGSTGRPKGVPHTHDDVLLGAAQVIQEMSLDRHDRALHIAPLFHVVGLNCFFNPHWFEGATNILQRQFDPEEALALIERHRVTGTLGVPAQIRALLRVPDLDAYDLSSLRYFRTGGDPISEQTIEQARAAFGAEFYNTYGLTETQQNVTAYTPDDPDDRQTSVGKASYFWEVRIVEPAEPERTDSNAVVDRPGRGLVLIDGPMLTDGYLNRPEATAEAFIDGWLYTGDIAEVDADGYITIVDRIDNMIKSGGENIYPQEVEDVLGDHEGVLDCGVLGTESEEWGEAVTAAVVAEADVTADDLDAYLQASERLADFKRPRSYKFVDQIPRNPGSGSIRREQLRGLVE